MRTLRCPLCKTNLEVDDSVRTVTCPRCLSTVHNPDRAFARDIRPLPVLPLDQQVSSDLKFSAGGVVLLILLVAIGLSIALWRSFGIFSPGIFVLLILLVFVTSLVVLIAPGKKQQMIDDERLRAGELAAIDEPGGVLNYQRSVPEQAGIALRPKSWERSIAGAILTVIAVVFVLIGVLFLALFAICGGILHLK